MPRGYSLLSTPHNFFGEALAARQWVDEKGRCGFSPINRPLDADDVRKHLAGEETLAIYLINEENLAHVGVIDIDIDKKALLEYARQKDKIAELRASVERDAERIFSVCQDLGIHTLIEDSGYKGRHRWFFFATPVPLKLVRTFLRLIRQRAGEPSPAIHWEIFPNCDKLRANAFGPLIKLPLGIHKRSGRRCVFLDNQGKPFGHAGAALEQVHRNTKEEIEALILAYGAPSNTATKENLAEAPMVQRLLDGCAIVRGLVEKAKAIHYLNHQERLTLLYTLGHLGDESRKYLHRIIGYTINYDYGITESYIRRMKPYPISCPKVKERHAELAVNSACDCHFKLPRGGYPSPILHAFRSPPKVWPPPNPQPKADRPPSEEKTAKGRPASPPSGKAEAPHGDDLSRQVRQGDSDSCRSAQEELNATLKKYIELKWHLRGVEKSLQRIEAELAAIFDRAGTDRLETELGILIRRKEKDKTEWVIDL